MAALVLLHHDRCDKYRRHLLTEKQRPTTVCEATTALEVEGLLFLTPFWADIDEVHAVLDILIISFFSRNRTLNWCPSSAWKM